MSGMNDSTSAIFTFLTSGCSEPVRDPVWGTVLFPETFMDFWREPEFQKLSRIRQLGPTHLIYPGAVHTRLSHSIGVYAIARRMLLVLMKDQQNAITSRCSLTGVRSFLVAALLHDLGHFPYTHSLKDLPLKSHESLAARLIIEDRGLSAVIDQRIGADSLMTAQIIDDQMPGASEEVRLYRTLLSGTLDPDKLDYLNRDAFFCGVPYGLQDVDFILTKIALTEDGVLGLQEQGISSIEHLLFSKYLMYRNIYWHRHVRSATAMIRKVLYLGLQETIITPEHLYGLDDARFHQVLGSTDYRPFSVIKEVSDNRLYQMALSVPYQRALPFIPMLRDQRQRFSAEERLRTHLNRTSGASLEPWQVIIDIPEPICLQSDAQIISGTRKGLPFLEADTIFTRPVIDRFTRTLTALRVFLPGSLTVTEEELFSVLS